MLSPLDSPATEQPLGSRAGIGHVKSTDIMFFLSGLGSQDGVEKKQKKGV
jgi:hypothetical protein